MKILVFGATGSQQFHVIGEAKNKGAEVYAVTSSEKNFSKSYTAYHISQGKSKISINTNYGSVQLLTK